MENEPKAELELKNEPSPEPSGLESSGSGPSPLRQRNAKGHREDCTCQVCARIQAAIEAGKLPKAQLREQARARTEAKKKAKAEDLSRRQLLRREEQKRRAAMVETSLTTQAQLGVKPSLEIAAKVAGVSAPTAKKIAGEDFVQTALLNAGITDAKLAEVAAEGIDAMIQRIITDRDGNIVDVLNIPDWRSRHLFWADLLRVKKLLGSDAENSSGGSGGLIIITPDNAKVLPGHGPACTCDGCLRAWEEKTAHLRRAAMKERALLEGVVNSQQQDPRQDPRAKNAIDANVIDPDAEEETEDEIERDDFGPIVG